MSEFNEHQKASKTDVLIDILSVLSHQPKNILVVGCGSGREAGMLAKAFKAETIGIDLVEEFDFDHEASVPAKLMKMDARKLEFADNTFDLVFSFHALEHIPGPNEALKEMSRVLKSGGSYLVGTPNKARLIGYVGSARPLRQKILFNLNDFKMRLQGRWSNEAGAHAGFTAKELKAMCEKAFGEARNISSLYYKGLYHSKKLLLEWSQKLGLASKIYPCVYFYGIKP